MENILINFNLELDTKKEIQKLINEDQKFNKLIKNLQNKKNSIEYNKKISILIKK